jgi:hypothetical protein
VREAVEVLRGHSVRVAVATPNGADAEVHAEDDDTVLWLRDVANRQLLSSPLSVSELVKQGKRDAVTLSFFILPQLMSCADKTT